MPFPSQNMKVYTQGGHEMGQLAQLFNGFTEFKPQFLIMYAIGGILIYLAIKKEYEPTLLLPIGFGCIIVNLPPVSYTHLDVYKRQIGISATNSSPPIRPSTSSFRKFARIVRVNHTITESPKA